MFAWGSDLEAELFAARVHDLQHPLLCPMHVTQFESVEHTAVNETAFYFEIFRYIPRGTIRAVIRGTCLFAALIEYMNGGVRQDREWANRGRQNFL